MIHTSKEIPTEYRLPGDCAQYAKAELLLGTLCSNGGGASSGCLRVEVGTARVHHGAVLGDFVDQRDARRNVETSNLLIGDLIQVLDQRTQGVTVCSNENGLALLGAREDLLLEVRNEALNDVLQALATPTWIRFRVPSA